MHVTQRRDEHLVGFEHLALSVFVRVDKLAQVGASVIANWAILTDVPI
jgi:hypothetical protein